MKKSYSYCFLPPTPNSIVDKRVLWLTLLALAVVLNSIFAATALANSAAMNKQQVREMVIRQASAWENEDTRTIVADFADDAIFIAAGRKFMGKKNIENAAQDYFRQFTDTKVTIKRIIIDGDRGAVEWDWQDKSRNTGNLGYAEDAIIFELQNNKIIYWREYIEKQNSRSSAK